MNGHCCLFMMQNYLKIFYKDKENLYQIGENPYLFFNFAVKFNLL